MHDFTHGINGGDFVLWTERQRALLREKNFEQLDLDRLIGELDAMAANVRRELKSRLETLTMNLLKCQFQPEPKSRAWLGAIREQRSEIERILEENPSLGSYIAEYAAHVYHAAFERAGAETGIPRAAFPQTIPYTRQQLLDPYFVPT
ncbi:DUF29 domain-containing protein [Massilia cavernae]|uniref:DUF29 domain-containing protein n=1 Tax=Massilia cavernae TaxID=2320864 RepID=A0A418XGE8_9BURK|nr:DUF29 domain-containing protein [Massilia cavernae]RJG11543.1 DUF29 domain-containing protein [Massilia cavernae]